MKPIALIDLKREYDFLNKTITPTIVNVIKESRFILGPEVTKFENMFARYCGTKYAVGVASGTAALHLALVALGIKSGDEVITTTMTFNATAEAIVLAGAKPVFVDIREDNLSIDTSKIETAITKSTKAIIAVHLYGIPADMKKIKQLCKKYNLFVIEDAAQAHGSSYFGRKAGSLGDIGCFSFMPAKNLGSYGDAGGIVTNNLKLAQKVRQYRDHGRIEKYVHYAPAFAERMDNLQAVVLMVKLKYLDQWNKQRARIAKRYDKFLDLTKVRLINIDKETTNSNYVYTILVDNRQRLIKRLLEKGISTGVYYPIPLHLQPMFKDLNYRKGALPVAEKLARQTLSLPMHPFLTIKEIDYVIDQVNRNA